MADLAPTTVTNTTNTSAAALQAKLMAELQAVSVVSDIPPAPASDECWAFNASR
jgi:hypothetical protein